MPISAGHQLRITAVMSWYGQATIENVFDLYVSSDPPGSDLDVMNDLAAWLDDAFDNVKALQVAGLLYREVRGFNVSGDGPLPTVGWPTLANGTNASDPLPSGVAGLVLFRTGAARVLGRKFVGGLGEGITESGLFNTGAISLFSSFGVALATDPVMTVAGGALKAGIFDKHGNTHAVSSVVVSAIPSYQRRRRPGRGI